MKAMRLMLFVLLILFLSSALLDVALAPSLHFATTTPSLTLTIPTQRADAVIDNSLNTSSSSNASSNTPKPKIITPSIVLPPQIVIPSVLPSPPPLSHADVYTYALARTVSLLCPRLNGEMTIATAFFVHESGILLTNGHVTENLSEHTCTVRQGAPAREIGTATLKYLPSAYTATSTYQGQAPNDISLWSYKPSNASSPTQPLSIFLFATNIPPRETVTTTFSYPAELVSLVTLLTHQYPLFSDAAIQGYDDTALALTGNAGAQKGSSGGVVIHPSTMEALGVIFGVSDIGPIGDRTLYALTAERINTIIKNEFGMSFSSYVASLAH